MYQPPEMRVMPTTGRDYVAVARLKGGDLAGNQAKKGKI